MEPLAVTGFVSVITLLALALLFDPMRFKKSKDGRALHLPPTIPWIYVLPRIGNIRKLLLEIEKRYGRLVCVHVPFRGTAVVCIGQEAAHWFHNVPAKELNDLGVLLGEWTPEFPDKLPTSSNGLKLIARCLSNQFYQDILTSLRGLLRDRVVIWAKDGENGKSYDAFEQAHSLILDVNTKVMFGDDWDEKNLAAFKQAFLISDPATWFTNPVYLLFPFLGRRVRKEAGKILVNSAICQAKKHQEQGIKPDQCSLDFYLSEFPQSPSIAAQQTWGLELASFITTASASSWFLYHIASDPKLQERVREDLRSAVPYGEELTLDHLSKMRFIDSLIREVIRTHLHGLNARAALTDLQYEGFDILKGMTVVCPHAPMHYSDCFKDPFEFKPDRFLSETNEFDTSDLTRTCVYLGFGAGRHPCLGMRLAVSELKILAYELLTSYDLKLANKPILPMINGLGFEQPKNSIRFLVSRRTCEAT
ncbi:cytochrome P450 [Cladochytrium replicatum]|nr:cytochrome P450 [Cladochytrium replicatum]